MNRLVLEDQPLPSSLTKTLGLPGATLAGLGSILGTGAFLALGLAAATAADSFIYAIPIAALLATCNALSSAELAAAHPVAGGTYEYAHRLVHPLAGFTAGWLFLAAKSCSAAAAALTLASYTQTATGLQAPLTKPALALAIILLTTTIAYAGLRRSTQANAILVTLTLTGLMSLLLTAFWLNPTATTATPATGELTQNTAGIHPFLEATALIFVAFTGYGRMATLGEEVRDPRKTIPRAVILTLIICAMLYTTLARASLNTLSTAGFAQTTRETGAPLQAVADQLAGQPLVLILTLAATTALLGVLLNLILGLSRVLLAMARRHEAPALFARINTQATNPPAAVIAIGLLIASIAITTNASLAWSVSALTVLIYYALTNLAALRLKPEDRLYRRWIPTAGLLGCLTLLPCIESSAWLVTGLLCIAGGIWRQTCKAGQHPHNSE
ncbi:APC family permease [Mucisphaera sp.]|uniref:APC family permease n=1 Tax=Mucisphaera sp. TaxID=2913024 RepID=UPI003D09B302